MVGKQFSVSVINLATAISSNRMQHNPSVSNDSNLKHALSEENLPTSVSSDLLKIVRVIYCEGQMNDETRDKRI